MIFALLLAQAAAIEPDSRIVTDPRQKHYASAVVRLCNSASATGDAVAAVEAYASRHALTVAETDRLKADCMIVFWSAIAQMVHDAKRK